MNNEPYSYAMFACSSTISHSFWNFYKILLHPAVNTMMMITVFLDVIPHSL
jgi:hypothetical protein